MTVHACVHPLLAVREQWVHDSTLPTALEGYSGAALLVDIIVPCGHMCVCEACAEQLTKTRTPMCPVCRGPIRKTMKVFCS